LWGKEQLPVTRRFWHNAKTSIKGKLRRTRGANSSKRGESLFFINLFVQMT